MNFNHQKQFAMVAGANVLDRGIVDLRYGHYGTTLAVISMRHELPDNPEVAQKRAIEYGERIIVCLNACSGIETEMLEKSVHLGIEPAVFAQTLIEQRDTAWEELRKIREAIKANPEEATFDEVAGLVSQRDALLYFKETAINSSPLLERCLNAEQQRDELLAALKDMLAQFNEDSFLVHVTEKEKAAIEKARAAITKAKAA